MRLQICIQVAAIACLFMVHVHSAPLISKIVNNSDFGYVILEHSDGSSCSLAGKNVIIDARSQFDHEFLLERGVPSVLLRPIYFLDPKTKQKILFVDDSYNFIPERLDQAHELWKENKGHKKFNESQLWMNLLVGLDISVVPHEVEIFGYLLNLSRVMVKNNIKQQVTWISFAKGIFSKLALELEVTQHRRKGIRANIKVLHGEGGVCVDGVIERLSATPTRLTDNQDEKG
ncbi:hypothetical protein A3J41_02990 [candidate division TM6 bacterium RIFCSPHIGHO2_12_FULL_38_8]|nr:MAG: hypothetical protein A3J41_02990 [candidate division TM6 bacterium RIFCSPHIGHO2_12_FULL_38_8]